MNEAKHTFSPSVSPAMRFSMLPVDDYIVDQGSSSDEGPSTSRRKPLRTSLASNIRRAFMESDDSDSDDWDVTESSLALRSKKMVTGPSMRGKELLKSSPLKLSIKGEAKTKAKAKYKPPTNVPLDYQYQSAAFAMPEDGLERWKTESSLQSWQTARASSSKLSDALCAAQNQAVYQAQQVAEERLRRETDEVRALLGHMQLGYEQREKQLRQEFEERNKRLWTIINGTIAESDRQHKARQAEEAKVAEKRKLEAAAKAQAQENLAKKRAQEEEAKTKAEEEDKSRKAAEEEAERVRASKEKGKGVMAGLGDKALEWIRWRDFWRGFKEGVVEVVRVDEGVRKDLRLPMRAITRGIGQVVNTREAILRVTGEIESNLNKALPQPPTLSNPVTSASAPPQIYSYLLNHVAKALIKQAEAEVNAHPEAAFPLAKIVVGLMLRGHALLGEVLFGRLVKKCPWVVPFYPAKQEGQVQRDYDKSLGQIGGEGATEYASRMAGILTFYLAITQTALGPLLQTGPPAFAQPSPEQLQTLVAEPLRLPAAWSWLAAICRTPLAGLDPAPLLVAVALEIAGPELIRVYGQRQVGKVLMAIATEGLGEGIEGEGVLANRNVPARQRLRLLIVEQWGSTGVLVENKAREWQ